MVDWLERMWCLLIFISAASMALLEGRIGVDRSESMNVNWESMYGFLKD